MSKGFPSTHNKENVFQRNCNWNCYGSYVVIQTLNTLLIMIVIFGTVMLIKEYEELILK